MWSDNETSMDYLNHSEVSELVCEMMEDATLLPLSVGIYGGWGVGKSSILNFIREQQKASETSIIVEFDAWLYQGFDEAKSALMTVIAQQLLEETPENLKEEAVSLFNRANKIKFLGLGAEVGMAAFGLPTFGFVSKALTSANDAVAGEGDQEDLNALEDAVQKSSQKLTGLFDPKEVRSAPEEITAFKNEFSKLLNSLEKTLIVFVDNLDRCLPKTAIQNLEAMRLFMSMPKTVFVVAADVDMIRHAVSDQFSGPSKKHVDDYLDKLIHFPVTVPRLGIQEVQAFLVMLVLSRTHNISSENCEGVRRAIIDKIRNSWADNTGISVEFIESIISISTEVKLEIQSMLRISPILAHSKAVAGNPRIIKRMMNIVKMRHSLAKRRGMALDEAVITKLSLFERCTDESVFADLLRLVRDAPDGKAKELSAKVLEAVKDDKSKIPERWREHADFISEWGALSPDFSEIDLRPAVYLARETLPIKIRSTSISPETISAIDDLLKISTQTSKAAQVVIANIPADERISAMNGLVTVLRGNSDWGKRRKDLNGPIVLAKLHPETKNELLLFLKSLPAPVAWLKMAIENLENEER